MLCTTFRGLTVFPSSGSVFYSLHSYFRDLNDTVSARSSRVSAKQTQMDPNQGTKFQAIETLLKFYLWSSI